MTGKTFLESGGSGSLFQNHLHFLETLLNTIPNPVFYKDANGVYQGCNKAFAEQILGMPKEEIVGRSLFDLPNAIPAKLADLYHKQDIKLMRASGTQFYEAKVQCADGVRRDFLFNKATFNDASGRVAGMIGIMVDITGRKKAEEELRDSEAHFRTLIENSTETVVILNEDGTIRYSTPANDRALGWAPEDVIGVEFHENVHPDDVERLFATFGSLMGTPGGVVSEIVRCRHKDGSWRTIEALGKNLLHDPNINGIVVNYHDITERRQAEERFMLAARVASDLIYEWTLSDDSLEWFGDIDKMLGFEPGAFPRTLEAWVNRIHPEDRKRLRDSVKRHTESTDPIHEEYRIQRKDGTWLYWIDRATPVLDNEGRPYKWIGVCSDITERKQVEEELRAYREQLEELVTERTRKWESSNEKLRKEISERIHAEKALQESEERFRVLTESTSDWIWEVDVNAVYTYASPKVRDLLGYDPEEVVGKTPFDLMCPEEAERVLAEFGSIVESQRAFAGLENKNRHKDGRIVILETSGVPIFDTEGTFQGYRGIDRDITERKLIEDRVRKLNEQLEQKVKERTAELEKAYNELKELDKMKDSFLSVISHEFRTPLTSIQSFSEILLHYDNEEKETQREFLEIINSESQRLTRLVNDVLDLSKIEANCMVYIDDFISLEEVIRDVVKAQYQLLQAKSLHLSLDLPSTLPTVFVDRDRINQVVSNLLGNAIKFSLQGGTIGIRAETFRGRRMGDRSEWIRVSISDKGIGLDKKDFKNIFNKFHQVSSDALKERPKGTGLGLPICKEIITHYQGNIFVESEKGKGSTFFFTLPAAKKTAPSSKEVLPASDPVDPQTGK